MSFAKGSEAIETMDSPPLHGWTAHSRWSRRGRSLEEGSERGGQNEPHASTLVLLCLTSLESSLGKGLATLSLEELPIVLADQIYNFIFSRGSRMAQMEISKALAPIMRQHINSFDCSRSRIGNSALLQLASGCGSCLVHLDLSECLFLGNNGILDLMFKCPSIRTLSLSGCNRVSDQVSHARELLQRISSMCCDRRRTRKRTCTWYLVQNLYLAQSNTSINTVVYQTSLLQIQRDLTL